MLLGWISWALAAPPAASGDLKDGAPMALTWAQESAVACFPATRFDQFTGHHVVRVETLPAGASWRIIAEPAEGVDLSLYVLQLSPYEKGARPPAVTAAWRCGASHFGGSGQPEQVLVHAPRGELELVIGVAGAAKTLAGAYTLRYEEVPPPR